MPISLRLEDDWADIAVNAIIDDLNDRSGLGIDSLEEDIQEEIKHTWGQGSLERTIILHLIVKK